MGKRRMIREVTRELLEQSQKNEITEYAIYLRLAKLAKDPEQEQLLLQIAAEEKAHADQWEAFTGIEINPNQLTVGWYILVGKLLGLSFALRQAVKREIKTSAHYQQISHEVPGANHFCDEEEMHRQQLLDLLKEKNI